MRLSLIVTISIIFLAFPKIINAQAQGGLTVNPALVDIELTGGERVEFEISYTNNSKSAVDLEIFSVDFLQTDEKGTLGFKDIKGGEYIYGLTSFLDFETNSIQLESGETKTLTAYVNNRQDLSPGGHYAAIIGRITTQGSTNSPDTKIAPAVSSLVYLIKRGGESYNLSLIDINWPKFPVVFNVPGTIALTFQNGGNTHLVPFGTIRVKDMLGREVYSGSINNSSFRVLPAARRIIPGYITKLEPLIPVSFMTLEIEGSDFNKHTKFLTRETFLYANPWSFLVLLVIPIYLVIKKRKR